MDIWFQLKLGGHLRSAKSTREELQGTFFSSLLLTCLVQWLNFVFFSRKNLWASPIIGIVPSSQYWKDCVFHHIFNFKVFFLWISRLWLIRLQILFFSSHTSRDFVCFYHSQFAQFPPCMQIYYRYIWARVKF